MKDKEVKLEETEVVFKGEGSYASSDSLGYIGKLL